MSLAWPRSAEAQVYKYEKPDGTVIFTDDLAELPPERRAYYNEKEKAARERAERARARMTPEERRAEELAAERDKLMRAEMEEAARQARLREIDAFLRDWRAKQKQASDQIGFWLEKKQKAEQDLARALAKYREAQAEWSALALKKMSFSLFPGQNARFQELQESLPELEAEVDAANVYLTETLPDEARKAGLPRGWAR
ncbi:MAG: hypothetical protein AAFU79_15155 [Myxococcota bacterium]